MNEIVNDPNRPRNINTERPTTFTNTSFSVEGGLVKMTLPNGTTRQFLIKVMQGNSEVTTFTREQRDDLIQSVAALYNAKFDKMTPDQVGELGDYAITQEALKHKTLEQNTIPLKAEDYAPISRIFTAANLIRQEQQQPPLQQQPQQPRPNLEDRNVQRAPVGWGTWISDKFHSATTGIGNAFSNLKGYFTKEREQEEPVDDLDIEPIRDENQQNQEIIMEEISDDELHKAFLKKEILEEQVNTNLENEPIPDDILYEPDKSKSPREVKKDFDDFLE